MGQLSDPPLAEDSGKKKNLIELIRFFLPAKY